MREIMKLPERDTLFMKMGYDFSNIPPRYLLLHNPTVLNSVHNASISQFYSGSVASKH
jgi:hypothetical protein